MKLIINFIILITLCSCDVGSKNNPDSSSNTSLQALNANTEDADFDGILDQDELEGRKYIADIPQVNMFDVNSVQTMLVFGESNSFQVAKSFHSKEHENNQSEFNNIHNSAVRKKLLLLAHNDLYLNETRLELFPLVGDLTASEIGCIDQGEQLKYLDDVSHAYATSNLSSGKVDFKFKFVFQRVGGVNQISDINSNINFASYFLDSKTEDVKHRIYQQYFNFNQVKHLKYMKEFKSQIEFNEEIGLDSMDMTYECIQNNILDFKYNRGEKKLRYQNVVSNLTQENATFIVSTPKRSDWVSVAPKGYESVIELFKSLGKTISLDDQKQITNFLGLKSDISKEVMANDITVNNIDKRKWFFYASNKKSINENLEPGVNYVLLYASAKEILERSGNLSEINSIELSSQANLGELKIGDQLFIKAKLQSKLNMRPNSSGVIAGKKRICQDVIGRDRFGPDFGFKSICRRPEWKHTPHGCNFTETNINPSLANWKEDSLSVYPHENISIHFNGRRINHFQMSRNFIGFHITVLPSDKNLMNSNLSFNNTTQSSYKYKRRRTERNHNRKKELYCTHGERDYDVQTHAKKQLKYTIEYFKYGRL